MMQHLREEADRDIPARVGGSRWDNDRLFRGLLRARRVFVRGRLLDTPRARPHGSRRVRVAVARTASSTTLRC